MHAACLAVVRLEGVAVFFTQGVMHLACEDSFMRAVRHGLWSRMSSALTVCQVLRFLHDWYGGP